MSDSIMDFRPGGSWRYAMQGPDGSKHWGMMLYKEIDPPNSLRYEDAFADEHGNVNEALPVATGVWRFVESGNGSTTVTMETHYVNEEALQQVVAMGMLEGMAIGLKQLEAVLADIGSK